MAGGVLRGAASKLSVLRNKRVLLVIAAVLVAGVLATLAAGFAQRMFAAPPPSSPPPPAAAAEPSSPNSPPGEVVEFRSEQAGFALSYPKSWTRLQSEDPQVELVAAKNQQDSFLVRVVELETAVGPEQLPQAKKLADDIVNSNESVELLAEPAQIELAGLPGYFYFYSFEDAATKQTGAHTHFFLFDGKKMITIVFQSVPKEQFPQTAPTFDQITSSFRLL
ncbi:MAG: hypothetical protein GEU83_08795 [Pseudonocardiaceae bacterium]|nr:hypothetical protein [Pseudonocardiaceae bacterium]